MREKRVLGLGFKTEHKDAQEDAEDTTILGQHERILYAFMGIRHTHICGTF